MQLITERQERQNELIEKYSVIANVEWESPSGILSIGKNIRGEKRLNCDFVLAVIPDDFSLFNLAEMVLIPSEKILSFCVMEAIHYTNWRDIAIDATDERKYRRAIYRAALESLDKMDYTGNAVGVVVLRPFFSD